MNSAPRRLDATPPRAPKTRLCLLLISAILLAGCEATKIPAYTAPANAGSSVLTAQNGGLALSVDPFLDAGRCNTYFKVNAPKQGLVIVHLRVENRSSSSTFLVRKSDFRLSMAGDGERSAADASVDHSSSAGDALALTGAALGSLPLLFIGGQLAADAEAVRQNFVTKEFLDTSLSPGRTAEGFIYYQLPKAHPKQGIVMIAAKIPATLGGTPSEFTFPVNYGVR